MRGSAFRLVLYSNVCRALPLMAHPGRWAGLRKYVMSIKIHLKAQKVVSTILALTAAGVLATGCRTPEPSRPEARGPEALRQDDPVRIGLERLNLLFGVMARSYTFELQPTESLVVTFHAQKNGVDEREDTFTRVVDFHIYQQYNLNYPTWEPLVGQRFVDVEILQPGHSWNQDRVKVSVRLPDFERCFYYDKPTNTATEFGQDATIHRGRRNLLLKLRYREPNGDIRTLAVEGEIRPVKTSS
jgi:hypothetical protein